MPLIPDNSSNIWITTGCGFAWDWCNWANVGDQSVDGQGGTREFFLHIDWWDPSPGVEYYDILMAFSKTPFDGSESYDVWASTPDGFSAYMDCTNVFTATGHYRFKIVTHGGEYEGSYDPNSILEMTIHNGTSGGPPSPPEPPPTPGPWPPSCG